MRQWGFPYMGSKSKIAESIISILPAGNRLVDLFGGGFAITHCAMCHFKWNSFLYNDINPLCVDLVKRAISGEFNENKFLPEWISREKFNEMKDQDGYVKYIWSFGNKGRGYLFGKDMEPLKKITHSAVVFNEISDDFLKMFPDFKGFKGDTVKKRRLEFRNILRNRFDLQQLEQLQRLEQLERLQQLEQLQRLEQLEQLEISCMSYLDYEYKQGDVVYCDIPYQDTAEYNDESFNHKEFYDWARSRPFAVYFSSYPIEGFEPIFEKHKLQTLSATNNSKTVTETVYWNGKGEVNKKNLLHNQLLLEFK